MKPLIKQVKIIPNTKEIARGKLSIQMAKIIAYKSAGKTEIKATQILRSVLMTRNFIFPLSRVG